MFEHRQPMRTRVGDKQLSSPYVRYVLGFIAFILTITFLLGSVLWWEHERDIERFTEITEYHLLSEQRLERMAIEIGLLEGALGKLNVIEVPQNVDEIRQGFPNKIDTAMFAISQYMTTLRAAQNRFQGRVFEPALGRLETSIDDLAATAVRLSQSGELEAAQLIMPIEALGFRIAQLDRLHSAAYEGILIDASHDRTLERSWLATGVVILLFVVLTVAFLTLKRIDKLARAQRKTEFELASALADAQKANAAKNDFLTHMSHDLRTPLNSILGFSQMMRVHTFGPLGDSHYEEYAKLIHHSGEKLVSMVNDVLDFARIESGDYDVHESRIDIREQAIASFQRCAAKPYRDLGERYKVQIAANARALKTDERAISQILDNLVSNAMKYAGDKASVTVEWYVDASGCGVLKVVDTGLGIPKRQLEKVLEPFVQGGTLLKADPYIARTGEGVGLGLHIVTKLSAILEAEFSLDSQEDKGTVASLVFPAKKLL